MDTSRSMFRPVPTPVAAPPAPSPVALHSGVTPTRCYCNAFTSDPLDPFDVVICTRTDVHGPGQHLDGYRRVTF